MKQRGFEILKKYEGMGIVLPKRQTEKSAGYDLASAERVEIPAGKARLISTGVKAYMQDDEVLELYIRSSMAVKYDLMMANNVGIIDADYYNNPQNEGEIMLKLRNFGDENIIIERGERMAQGIFKKYLTVDEEDLEFRKRTGGFGSTGK